jgi:hypothetical protein
MAGGGRSKTLMASPQRRRAHQKAGAAAVRQMLWTTRWPRPVEDMLLLVIESARFRDSTAALSGGQPRLHGRGSFCHG